MDLKSTPRPILVTCGLGSAPWLAGELRALGYAITAERDSGVELVGNVTDSTGRPGVAVAMTDETTHIRQVLILDPTTSQLLAEEQRVVAGNEFGWPSGTLMGSQTYLVHAVAGSNSEVPPAQK